MTSVAQSDSYHCRSKLCKKSMGGGNGSNIARRDRAWSFKRLLFLSFSCRILLVYYGIMHDYLFKVRYTDVDYIVFSDAAALLRAGDSPYARATYRYTPVLAFILLPNTIWPEFGKWLFCIFDTLVGILIYRLICMDDTIGSTRKADVKEYVRRKWVLVWLFNPFIAIVSSRGNADCIACLSVLLTLFFIKRKEWIKAAINHGLFAVHFKLYPIIYLPSLFMHLSCSCTSNRTKDAYRKCTIRFYCMNGLKFVLISTLFYIGSVFICYSLFGYRFVEEYLIYHISRTDTRHNFSPYFYILYLVQESSFLSKLVGLSAFLPQLVLILWFAHKYHKDLAFCWFLSTISFVHLNKVSTSQYFLWYICYIPLIYARVNLSTKKSLFLVLMWLFGQALWLLPAYLLEFKGMNTFFFIWIASLVFFAINVNIIASFDHSYSPPANELN